MSAGNLARTWAKQNIDKAAEWTSSLKGAARIHAARSVMSNLAPSDPNKAMTWMKTMSGDAQYKSLLHSFINSVQNNHPEIALAHLNQIGKKNREDKKVLILTKWAGHDKGAAIQWMQNNNIDAAAQKKILSYGSHGYLLDEPFRLE